MMVKPDLQLLFRAKLKMPCYKNWKSGTKKSTKIFDYQFGFEK